MGAGRENLVALKPRAGPAMLQTARSVFRGQETFALIMETDSYAVTRCHGSTLEAEQ